MAKHAPPETRKAQILEAAMACFGEHGYHETSMDDIAARTGLSKGAVYHHFAGKREILLALFEFWSDRMLERWEQISRETDPLTALTRDAQAAFTIAEEAAPIVRASFEMLAHAVRDDEMRSRIAGVYDSTRAHFASLLLQAREQGLVHDLDEDSVAYALIGMFEGLFILKAMDPDRVDVGAAWNAGVSALLRGLAGANRNGGRLE
jgi:AcrR family transcriptional regulator